MIGAWTDRSCGALRFWAGLALLWVGFGVSAWPFLWIPPDPDSMVSLWTASRLPWWAPFVDRLSHYDQRWFFTPLLTVSYYVDLALPPAAGASRHHVVAGLGLLVLSAILARMVLATTSSSVLSWAAAALLLFSAPTWIALGFTVMRHYVWASALGLLCLRPAWAMYFSDRPPGRGQAWASGLALGLGLLLKEAIAGVPLLVFALVYARWRDIREAARFVLPHAIALGVYIVWRWVMLGGLGGYFHMPPGTHNPLILPLMLAAWLWGSAWIGAVVLALSLVLRPRVSWAWAVATVGTTLPFVFTGPSGPDDLGFSGKLLLAWAVYLLLLCESLKRLPRRLAWLVPVGLVGLLLPLQWPARDGVHRAAVVWTDFRTDGVPRPPWDRPMALVSKKFWLYTFAHQMQAEPKPPLFAFMTPEDAAAFRALGGTWPPEAGANFRLADLPTIRIERLDREDVTAHLDGRGVFHLRIPRREVGRVRVGILYKNGDTHWFTSLPVHRSRIAFPLTYSDQAMVVMTLSAEGHVLARAWPSPFFRDPYPGEGRPRDRR